jgi:four helix bundle protein
MSETESKLFDFQKWPVYEKALEFVGEMNSLCKELPRDDSKNLRDQLRRASHSIIQNIAEGTSRFSQKEKANYYRISKGSLFECVAIVDLIKKENWVERDLDFLYRDMQTIARMLSGLIKYIENDEKKKNHQSGYAAATAKG